MNQAIIAFNNPEEFVDNGNGSGYFKYSDAVVKVSADVSTSDRDSISSYANIFILPQAADVNLADNSGTNVTVVESSDVTEETDHPFGVGVGYVKIRYVMP